MVHRNGKPENHVGPFVPTAVIIFVLLGLMVLMSKTGLLELAAQQRPF